MFGARPSDLQSASGRVGWEMGPASEACFHGSPLGRLLPPAVGEAESLPAKQGCWSVESSSGSYHVVPLPSQPSPREHLRDRVLKYRVSHIVLALGFASAFIPGLLGGCGAVQGSRVVVEAEYDVLPFDQIVIHGPWSADITVGSPLAILVTTDDNLLQYLSVRVDERTLKIETRNKLETATTLGITVSVPSVRSVHLDAAARAVVHGQVAVDHFSVELLGGSAFQVLDLRADTLTAVLGESSEAIMAGSVDIHRLSLGGRSTAFLENLQSRTVHVDLSNGSTASIAVHTSLDGRASGGSAVTVAGPVPTINISVSGGSTVRRG